MVMARMILANQTICTRSTFCLFPAIAAFGRSMIQSGGVAYFVPPISKAYDNIMVANMTIFIPSWRLSHYDMNQTIAWLKGEIEQ